MTTSLTMTNLDPDAPPAAWSLTELLPLVTAMVGQRDPLLEQNAGLQLQLHGGERSGQRLIGGLASSGSALLGAVVVPLLVGMLGGDAQALDFLGREWRRSRSSRRQRCPNRRRSRVPNSFGENRKRLDPLASTARHCRPSGETRSKTSRPMALVQHVARARADADADQKVIQRRDLAIDLVDRNLARTASGSQPRTRSVLAQHPSVVAAACVVLDSNAVVCHQQVVDHRRHRAVAPEILAAFEDLIGAPADARLVEVLRARVPRDGDGLPAGLELELVAAARQDPVVNVLGRVIDALERGQHGADVATLRRVAIGLGIRVGVIFTMWEQRPLLGGNPRTQPT
jgi:hypothetical protein